MQLSIIPQGGAEVGLTSATQTVRLPWRRPYPVPLRPSSGGGDGYGA